MTKAAGKASTSPILCHWTKAPPARKLDYEAGHSVFVWLQRISVSDDFDEPLFLHFLRHHCHGWHFGRARYQSRPWCNSNGYNDAPDKKWRQLNMNLWGNLIVPGAALAGLVVPIICLQNATQLLFALTVLFSCPQTALSIGDLVTDSLTNYYTLLKNTIIQHSERLETFDQRNEETWPDQQK